MKRYRKFQRKCSVGIAILFALVFAGAFAPRAAAQTGSVSGQVLDLNAKPWPGVTIEAVGDQGQKQEAKTDNDGKYSIRGLRTGVYTVTISAFPPPNDKQPPFPMAKLKVDAGQDQKVDANFKDIIAKQGAAAQEQVKKQEEERQKFQGMKAHFDAGVALLAQASQAKTDLAKAAADQRDALKAQVKDLSDKAVTELEAAKAGAPEKDQNLHLIWARLGDAYDAAGRSEDAANAYKQAIDLKPSAAYYNNLGGILGRGGKIDEAMAAYRKSAELDPTNAAQAYRNGGITLYNAGKLKEAIEPLKKATELDPKNAQGWYLLGASLVYNMTTKRVGDKEEVVFAPGTIEAYQKAIELDPNGTYGQQAKLGLEQLQQMAPGIDIKIKKRKS